jgi:hypothetical protein
MEQRLIIILALDSLNANYGLTIQGVDITASHAITLTADMVAGSLTLNGSQLNEGEYNLAIRMLNSTRVARFYHSNIPFLAMDTQRIKFGIWDGSGTITLEIDHGSDGNFEETLYLDNNLAFLFLPLMSLNR